MSEDESSWRTHKNTHTNIHTHTHTHTHAQTSTPTHTHAHTYRHKNTHTHTHTHGTIHPIHNPFSACKHLYVNEKFLFFSGLSNNSNNRSIESHIRFELPNEEEAVGGRGEETRKVK